MRKVRLGQKEVGLRASPLALLYYRQAFNKDLVADLVGLQSLQNLADGEFSGFDSVLLLQIAYAMHRASEPDKSFPAFEQWLDELGNIDFGDPEWFTALAEEAMEGFFHSAGAGGAAATGKAKK